MSPNGAKHEALSPKKHPLTPSQSTCFLWIQQNTPSRRVLLLGTVIYASVMLLWLAHSIGAFTSRLDGDMKTRELKCVGWRATRGCSPNGPRDPEKDENCTQIIPRGESGYCEVDDTDSGERFRVMRRHCNSLIHTEALKPSFQLPNMNEARRDGVVMVVYPKLLASAYATIKLLRNVLHCQLPVEIWFRPDEMKNATILEPLRRLAKVEGNITFQEINDPRAKRFVAKIHAIYHSSFDRVLFLDADNVPVRDPSFLFTSPEFVKTGAIFWPDFWHPDSTIFGIYENALLWELIDMPFVDMFEQESGQLVVDRRRHAAPLALVWFYALHRPDFFSSLRLVWGDKDLFRLAWLKLEIPFTMIQTPPGMAGIIYNSLLRSDFCGLTMVQHDADGEILFLHRNQHKLTGKFTDSAEDSSLQEKVVDAVDVVPDSAERYADPTIWTHLLRFRKESSRRNYAIQSFRLDLDFETNKKCFGRRDVYRNPNFYVQEITAFNFSGLETLLRRFALESTQFSPDA
ncbi:hypothetical protein PC123_g16820 [Phytophthora cactorum]|nr:hypothetical protein PC123_g16820 [Phytophthora cactorum]